MTVVSCGRLRAPCRLQKKEEKWGDRHDRYEVLKKKDMSFICCEGEADFGTVGVENNKVINFERN